MRPVNVLTTCLVVVLLAALAGSASAQTFSFGNSGCDNRGYDRNRDNNNDWVVGALILGILLSQNNQPCPPPFYGGFNTGNSFGYDSRNFGQSYNDFSRNQYGQINPRNPVRLTDDYNRFDNNTFRPINPNLDEEARLNANIAELNSQQKILGDRIRVIRALFEAGYITRQAYESEKASLEARRTQLGKDANLAAAQLKLLRDLRRY